MGSTSVDNRRLARDPLADLLGDRSAGGPTEDQPGRPATPPPPAEGQGQPATRKRASSARITVQLDDDLAEQVRDAVMRLHTVGVHTTISAIAAAGLRTELDRLATEHNHGRPFPPRRGDVPVGRPPK